jgi:glycerophosphoryl diester phosphodiesterase
VRRDLPSRLVTADGRLVVRHDSRLPAGRRVEAVTRAELRRQGVDLLTLDEATDVLGRRVPIMLDIKGRRVTLPLARWLARRRDPEAFVVCSGNGEDLLELRGRGHRPRGRSPPALLGGRGASRRHHPAGRGRCSSDGWRAPRKTMSEDDAMGQLSTRTQDFARAFAQVKDAREAALAAWQAALTSSLAGEAETDARRAVFEDADARMRTTAVHVALALCADLGYFPVERTGSPTSGHRVPA